MTFMELLLRFPTERHCIDFYIKIRYGDKVHCNHCGSPKTYQRNVYLKVFNCNECNNTFSPFKGTIFEKSSTDMRKWYYAIHLFMNGKKGISAMQLKREIGVTYKCAWRMLQQIRIAMGNVEQKEFFDTIIEMDETYIGGKPRKKNEHDDDDKPPKPPYPNYDAENIRDVFKKPKRDTSNTGRGTKKTPVIGVIDRNNKVIYARVATPNAEGKQLTALQLFNILNKVSKPGNKNTIITDEFSAYRGALEGQAYHLVINHSQFYSQGETHTNNIESFWGTLKRGVYGIYHHISVKYMQRYVNEFCFRYNNRDYDMFSMVLGQARL